MQLTAYGSWLFLEVWLHALHFSNARQSTARIYSVMKWGTGRFDIKSFRYKFTQWRSKKFHLLGLKNEEHSPFTLKWRKFWCNFTAWVRIKTTCLETTLNRNDRFPWDEVTHNIIFCSESVKMVARVLYKLVQFASYYFIVYTNHFIKLASLMETCHQVYTSLPDPYNLKEMSWEKFKQEKNV